MKIKEIIPVLLTGLLLTAALSGCGCQAGKQVEMTEPLDLEATTQPNEIQQTIDMVAVTEAAEENSSEAPTEAAESTTASTEELWGEDSPEDTRPPVEVTLPEGTQPYTDYERYMDMSGEEQKVFFDSFEDKQDFFNWFNAAKDEYEKAHPPVIIDGSTNIELVP